MLRALTFLFSVNKGSGQLGSRFRGLSVARHIPKVSFAFLACPNWITGNCSQGLVSDQDKGREAVLGIQGKGQAIRTGRDGEMAPQLVNDKA